MIAARHAPSGNFYKVIIKSLNKNPALFLKYYHIINYKNN